MFAEPKSTALQTQNRLRTHRNGIRVHSLCSPSLNRLLLRNLKTDIVDDINLGRAGSLRAKVRRSRRDEKKGYWNSQQLPQQA